MEAHNAAVSHISAQVASFHQRKVPFRLYHGSTNSTNHRKVDPLRMVDTSQLNHVLKIDKQIMTALVEPNVPMDQLVEELGREGMLPRVVMEFPGITAGGGFSGTAGESSGFKYGFFENTVASIEIVKADGEVVTVSPSENEDLFYGAAGTFGTLGVTTLLEIRCLEAKKYVELTYIPTTSTADALEKLQRECEDKSNDYVDGILFAEDRGVIVTGKLTNEREDGQRRQRFLRAQDPWFYIHAERLTKHKTSPVTELSPLKDYLFRYDRGAFWTGRYAFTYFLTPFNRITRYLLDWFMHTRVMYHALHASGHGKGYIIQDLLIPADKTEEFVRYVGEEFGFWPLWLCPFRIERGRELSLHPRLGEGGEKGKPKWYVNVGVWGPSKETSPYSRFVAQNRRLESKVRELGGIKWLYGQAFYTQEEFAEIYDQRWYEGLREKYGAGYLPSVYEKTRTKTGGIDVQRRGWWAGVKDYVFWSVWPVSGLYGVFMTLWERDYLMAK